MSSPHRRSLNALSMALMGDAGAPPRDRTSASLRVQGLGFSALAWLAVVACLWLPPLRTQLQLAMLAPVILLLGVPHGALDVVFVRQLAGVRSVAGWSLFTLAYVAVAASIVLLWWLAPGIFLVLFLLVSVFHFSGDPEGRTPVLLRTLYGGAVVFCPLALHAAEVTQLFAFLAGWPAAQTIVMVLRSAAWPWTAAIFLAAVVGARRAPVRSIEVLSLAALLAFTPPLIGFTLFFCVMHSARHVLRTRDYSTAGTFGALLRVARWPMLATLAGAAIAVGGYSGRPLDLQLVQVLFVGLAALTVPHMIVVERVRLTGWIKGRALSIGENA